MHEKSRTREQPLLRCRPATVTRHTVGAPREPLANQRWKPVMAVSSGSESRARPLRPGDTSSRPAPRVLHCFRMWYKIKHFVYPRNSSIDGFFQGGHYPFFDSIWGANKGGKTGVIWGGNLIRVSPFHYFVQNLFSRSFLVVLYWIYFGGGGKDHPKYAWRRMNHSLKQSYWMKINKKYGGYIIWRITVIYEIFYFVQDSVVKIQMSLRQQCKTRGAKAETRYKNRNALGNWTPWIWGLTQARGQNGYDKRNTLIIKYAGRKKDATAAFPHVSPLENPFNKFFKRTGHS